MIRTIRPVLTLAASLALMFSTAPSCLAGGAEFEDDFERADGPADGWTVVQGAWDIVDGTMTTTASGNESWAWAGDPAFSVTGNMTAEFNLQFGEPPADVVGRHGGIMLFGSTPTLRADGAINGYLIDWIDRVDDHGIRVIRYDNGTPQLPPIQTGTPNIAEPPITWRLEVEGATIRILADDVLAVEFDDDTHRAGHLGFWAFGNGTQIILDNVFIEYTPRCVVPCATTSILSGIEPHTVDFDASCSSTKCADLATIEWDFGDGSSEEGAVVSHEFEFSDTYVVTMTVRDVDGDSDSRQFIVTVFPDGGNLVDEFDQADGPPDDWTVFSGEWQVIDEELVGSGIGGESWIWAGDPALFFPPVFEISFDITFLVTPADAVGRHAGIMFCATEATNRAGANSGYELDWIDRVDDHGLRLIRVDSGMHTLIGQGARDLPEPPASWRIAVGPQSIQVFGDGELLVDVVDDTHRGGLFGLWAWANGQQVAYDNFGGESPDVVACFNATPGRSVAVGTDITFDAGCSRSDSALTSWEWDFGDGNTASGEVAEHTYEFADNYVVTLTVENESGASESSSQAVSVFEVTEGFMDEFDRDDGPPAGWTVIQGDWTIIDGALQIATPPGNPESWIWAGDPATRFEGIEQFSFNLEFLNQPFDGIGRHGGAFFFADNTSPRFSGNSGYSVDWIDRTIDQGYRISVWNAGVETPLVAGNGDVEPGLEWLIEVEGDTIRLIVDDEMKAEVIDSTWRSGHFGFWSYFNDQVFEIDSVVIGETDDVVDEDCDLEGDEDGNGLADCDDPACEDTPACDEGPRLVRGDSNSSGVIDLTDGVVTLNFLFTGGPPPVCRNAADTDNNGQLVISDAVITFSYLFTGGPAPVAPSPSATNYDLADCGPDTDGDLSCETPAEKCL